MGSVILKLKLRKSWHVMIDAGTEPTNWPSAKAVGCGRAHARGRRRSAARRGTRKVLKRKRVTRAYLCDCPDVIW